MATSYEKVFSKFLNFISDTSLSKLTQTDLETILIDYLDNSASVSFKECKSDLSDRDDTLKQFNQDLSQEEIFIVAYSMLLYWIEPKIKYERLLIDAIGDRDYKESSHANQLKELLNLKKDIEDNLERYIISYTFNGDLSELGGV